MSDVNLSQITTEEGLEVAPGVRVRLRSLADYRQNPDNPVSHTPRNLGAVVESIHKVGAFRSGGASKGKVLAGNLTLDAMTEAGIEGVVEVTTDGTKWVMVNREDLSPEQEKQAAYGDQQGSFLAGWELDQVLADVEAGVNLEGIFSESELRDWSEMAGIDYDELWQGMPEFEQEDAGAAKTIKVHFATLEAMDSFAELIEQTITEKTKYIWYPEQERVNLKKYVAHES